MSEDRSDEIRWRVAVGERDELRQIGDLMQSEASRLVGWADDAMKAHPTTLEMPYEVRMALIGVNACIDDWTAARRRSWPSEVRLQLKVEAT